MDNDDIVVAIVGLIVLSLVLGFCIWVGEYNGNKDVINKLCNKQQYDFCIEDKNWRLKD